jgi:hypothetical protein
MMRMISMNSKIKTLIISPSIFAPADISAPMAEKVYNVYNLKGGNVEILEGIFATRIPIITKLQEDYDLIIYMGHGQADRICGENPFCDAIGMSDLHLFEGKIVVCAPACEVGKVLGPASIQNGARTFIGATTSMYGAWPEYDHNYYADWREYFEMLYKGLLTETTNDAVQMYKNRASNFIELYKSKEGEWPNADWYINATYVNRDRLEIFGDKTAQAATLSRTDIKRAEETIEEIMNWYAPPLI